MCMLGGAMDLVPMGETDISRDAPYMRTLLARRYEDVWKACEPHVSGSHDEERADPRFLIVGLRALQMIQKLYKLDQPSPPEQGTIAGTGPDRRALLAGYLDEVAARS
jgi:hypothetical protein